MKTTINWFSIPVIHFERAYAFYCFIFDKKFERILEPDGWEIMPFQKLSESWINWCVTSDTEQKVSKDWIWIYLNAEWIIDDVLNRIIPAGWKIIMPKKRVAEYGFIAHIEDSEGNLIWLHSTK